MLGNKCDSCSGSQVTDIEACMPCIEEWIDAQIEDMLLEEVDLEVDVM